jgi:enoyl-CoA hydratase/carnithine racemase
MSEYQDILYEVDEGVARISLNRPQYRNAQSRILLEELDDALGNAGADNDVRAIVLRGEGEHFSAGHDLGSPEQVADRQARPELPGVRGRLNRGYRLYVDMSLRWRDIPKPTIAAVQGYCIFGGWMVASAMDLIFASEDAQFLCSAFQYFTPPWDLGLRKAKEILFESRFIGAQEAMEHGLVSRIYPRAELDAQTMAYAKRVAQNDLHMLRTTKMALNQTQDAQGFTMAIKDAYAMSVIRLLGESDPDATVPAREGKRRAMVQRAMDNRTAH